MKKQKIFLTFLLAALMLTAAGCGNSDSSSKSESKPETGTSDAVAEDSSAPDAEPSEAVTEATEVTVSKAESASEAASAEEPESTKPQAASNTTYDVGEFSVFVPEGWNAIAVPDHIDSSKTATNDILMAKGAEYKEASGSWDYENGPYFYITLLGKEDFEKALEYSRIVKSNPDNLYYAFFGRYSEAFCMMQLAKRGGSVSREEADRRYQEVIAFFRNEMLKADEGSAYALLFRTRMYAELGKYEKAEELSGLMTAADQTALLEYIEQCKKDNGDA